MRYTITYYSDAVQAGILALPLSVVASYFRLSDLLEEFGPSLRMPHSKALSKGPFELQRNV